MSISSRELAYKNKQIVSLAHVLHGFLENIDTYLQLEKSGALMRSSALFVLMADQEKNASKDQALSELEEQVIPTLEIFQELDKALKKIEKEIIETKCFPSSQTTEGFSRIQ
jgi:aerobic-type carbon monoxide dehydrogenase small subunit (CoxS/CutS family)